MTSFASISHSRVEVDAVFGAAEDEGEGLNGWNDWSVWNGSVATSAVQ